MDRRTQHREHINIMSKKKHSFNVLLSEQEYVALDKLAHDTHCARSFIIRQCLQWRFEMHTAGTPLCASGQRCFAPHLHMVSLQKRNEQNGA